MFGFVRMVVPSLSEDPIENILTFGGVGDQPGFSRDVRDSLSLDVNGEGRIRFQIGLPITSSPWPTRDEEAAFKLNEIDFDSSLVAGLGPNCCDVDHAAAAKT